MGNTISRASSGLLAVSLAFALAACSPPNEPSVPGNLQITVASDAAIATPSQPAFVQVTARNTGGLPVSWGPGSSTCRLSLLVRSQGEDHLVPRGPCTADLATYVLQPGESRTEIIAFAGQHGSPAGTVTLRTGSYEVRGAALPVATSDPVVIEVRADT
jgi:hypothetical protein